MPSYSNENEARLTPGELEAFRIPLLIRLVMKLSKSSRNFLHQLFQTVTIDPLTKLLNRSGFEMMFQTEMALLLRKNRPHPVVAHFVFFDLDNFKKVNDGMGHSVGDSVLTWVAIHLRQGIKRPTDLVCRLGGDEFLVVLFDSSEAAAVSFAKGFLDRMSADDYHMKYDNFRVSASYGIRSDVINTLEDLEQKRLRLVTDSDAAMYEQKRRRKELQARI